MNPATFTPAEAEAIRAASDRLARDMEAMDAAHALPDVSAVYRFAEPVFPVGAEG